MKRKSTFLIAAALLIVLVCPGFIIMNTFDYNNSFQKNSSYNSLEYEQINPPQNNIIGMSFHTDTFDIDFDMEEFDEQMNKLHKELEKFKSFKFEFDFDKEEFKTQMEELKKELSELDFEEFHFEFDDAEFRKSMEELKKELEEQKYSFHFEMDNFKEEMLELKEELKHLDIDLKDIDIELDKLNGFMEEIREELESDGLIDDKDDDFDLDLNRDEMIINGESVTDELFKKYKDIYEEHFGKKLNGDHKLKIR